MKTTKKFCYTAVAVLTLALALAGCEKNKTTWFTDVDEAKSAATKQNKNILLLFSGDDWDGISATLKENVFTTKTFVSKAQKKYVLLNVDFSQTEYAKTEITDASTDEEIEEAMRIQTLYMQKEDLAEKYNLSMYPSLYVITPDEYGLCSIEFNETDETPESLLEKLEQSEETQANLVQLIKSLDGAEGLDKVLAIDALYNATDIMLRNPLADFAQEVVSLDPNNQTGVIGKYEYELANQRAMQYAMYANDVVSAAKEFEDVCETGHLSASEKQNAYYMSAYILAMQSEPDFEKMISLMEKSYEQDEQSDLAPQILEIIENIKQVRDEQK